jgi:hypothetical protein
MFFAFTCHAGIKRITYLAGSFEASNPAIANITDIINEFTNTLYMELAGMKFYRADPGDPDASPDYIISGQVDFDNGRYTFHIVMSDFTNKFHERFDDIYTGDTLSLSGTRDAARQAAGRIVRLSRDQILTPYRERHDYKRDEALKTGNNGSPQSAFIFNFIDVPMKYPYGYNFNFPLAFGIDLFEAGYTVFLPGTSLGIGIGTKAVDILGPTAATFLPLIIYVPLYISPGDYGMDRRDLYFTAESGILVPQYSYFDLSLNLIINGISFSAGWLALPEYSNSTYYRPFFYTFYAGLKISFGVYELKRRSL